MSFLQGICISGMHLMLPRFTKNFVASSITYTTSIANEQIA